MRKGRYGMMTHDCKRHGTTTLFAAPELKSILCAIVPASSALSSTIHARHTCFCAPCPDRGSQPLAVARTKPRAGWNHSSTATHYMEMAPLGAGFGGRTKTVWL